MYIVPLHGRFLIGEMVVTSCGMIVTKRNTVIVTLQIFSLQSLTSTEKTDVFNQANAILLRFFMEQ